ncbi:alpha-ketoglutarate-dependent dioxygenase AlkB [uncultured Parasphingopyxis sp.]|uniref:alpha-ketoglutarate-dependent dioxygenase AlkB family protein n=1 Tax=uncultured Parasphingopyxis sp. TaxID=1547918 RepID=UPI0026103C9C|nr:alpha-ketoglutarate-dependent dioxygenase AlkB [uncultured Parasphingopyxis sp.]
MDDLFASDLQFRHVRMPDSDVSYIRQFPYPMENAKIFRKLYDDTIWLHEEVMVWGKKHKQPRLTAWYGDPGKSYTYSSTIMHPLPWTDLLLSIRQKLEELIDERFNSVLLNLYRDHRDSMGFHSDNEKSLGPDPTIASLSYGATRTLIFKHKKKKDLKINHLELKSGSLLLMKGCTQKNWNHGINKQSQPCGPRINLTFRYIYPD